MSANNNKLTLCISLNSATDKDIIAWCNAQSNVSASFRSIIRQSIRHKQIMDELQAIRKEIKDIKIIEATPQKKKRKVDIEPEALANLDNL